MLKLDYSKLINNERTLNLETVAKVLDSNLKLSKYINQNSIDISNNNFLFNIETSLYEMYELKDTIYVYEENDILLFYSKDKININIEYISLQYEPKDLIQYIKEPTKLISDLITPIQEEPRISISNVVEANYPHYTTDPTKASCLTSLYNNSLLSLSGSKYKSQRKQLNKLDNTKLRIETINLKDSPNIARQLTDIEKLIHTWISQRKASKKIYKGHSLFTVTTLKELTTSQAHLLNKYDFGITGIIIYDTATNKPICYGIDQLDCLNLVRMIDGKFNMEYAKEYPDLNKLINHFEFKNAIDMYKDYINIDYAKATLGSEMIFDLDSQTSSLIDFKRSLANGIEIKTGTLRASTRPTKYVMYNLQDSKRTISIFG